MNWLADENVDAQIIERLRELNFVVESIAEISPSIDDDKVLSFANESNAVLLTGDKDFGELIFRRKLLNCGVVLLRLSGLPPLQKAILAADAIAKHGNEMAGKFSVIAPTSVRIRKIIR